ncbi:hypothetical protein CPC08DRAFT_729357, partial [Agrocybe pediades]
MTTPKTQNKGSSSKPRSVSGSKAPSVNSESAQANKKQGLKKRVTIEEIQPDSQSVGLGLRTVAVAYGLRVLRYGCRSRTAGSSSPSCTPNGDQCLHVELLGRDGDM